MTSRIPMESTTSPNRATRTRYPCAYPPATTPLDQPVDIEDDGVQEDRWENPGKILDETASSGGDKAMLLLPPRSCVRRPTSRKCSVLPLLHRK